MASFVFQNAHLVDPVTGIDTVRDIAGADPGRLLLVGHSAGGLLALLAGAPAAVLGLASLTDLAAAHAANVGDDSIARFLGGTPDDVPGHYAAAAPRRGDDVVLVHGTDDLLVPVEQSRNYAAEHPGVALLERPGTGHFELLDPDRDHWSAALNAVARSLPPPG